MNWPLVFNAAGILIMIGIHIATVRFHGKQIDELKTVQVQQQERLGKHSERLMRVETKIEDKLNGRAHGVEA